MATDYTIAEERDGRGTFVRGLAEVEVKDENGALNLLFSGGLSRTIATHKLNKRSNRSHSIFTMYLQQRQRSGVSERVVHSKLHLVDLAGSERLKKTMDSIDGTTGDEVTRKESMAINQSLTYLEQCVVALARRNHGHIPYRQSKLTNILKDCLGANCNTVMIACMWGESSHLEETVSTLRLASRMMRVQNETASVETIDPSALIKKQEKIIRALKQELLMHDALVERTGVAYDPYTPEQQESISQMIERFIETPELEEESVLNITNYRQMLEICKQFKKKLSTARGEAQTAKEQMYMGYANTPSNRMMNGSAGNNGTMSGEYAADSKIADEFDPKSATFVGETARGPRSGFSLGISTAGGPAGGIEGAYSRHAQAKDTKATSPSAKSARDGNYTQRSEFSPNKSVEFDNQMTNDEKREFENYARTDGKELYDNFVDNKATLKELRAKYKECVSGVNSAKDTIDKLQGEIEQRKSSRIEHSNKKGAKGTDMVDEEEFKLTREMKEAKLSYKNCFEQMQKYKTLSNEAQQVVDTAKADLAAGFLRWNSLNSMGSYGGNFSPTNSPGRSRRRNNNFDDDNIENTDQLDDQEAFDKMEEERVISNDPESLAFFHAQKTRRANVTQKAGTLKQMQKNKRFV